MISKIKSWLLYELKTEEQFPLDGTHDIRVGRVECAKSLWNKIQKWEEENEINQRKKPA
tara:strand:+ start:924 stop:1100 length:177 start_codon:yes stop_codon:yes gene_type:complete